MNFLSTVSESIRHVSGTISNAAMSAPSAVVNAGVSATKSVANAGVSATKSVANAGVSATKSVAEAARDMTINMVVDSGKFITGVNNLENAYTFLTQKEAVKVKPVKAGIINVKDGTVNKRMKKYTAKSYVPGNWERVSNAVGELPKMGAKLGTIAALAHGAYSTHISIPTEILSFGSATSLLYNGTVAVVSISMQVAGNLTSNVAVPAVQHAASVATNNIVATGALTATAALFYSAKQNMDVLETKKFGQNKNEAPSYFDVTKNMTMAAAKVAAGTAVLSWGLFR